MAWVKNTQSKVFPCFSCVNLNCNTLDDFISKLPYQTWFLYSQLRRFPAMRVTLWRHVSTRAMTSSCHLGHRLPRQQEVTPTSAVSSQRSPWWLRDRGNSCNSRCVKWNLKYCKIVHIRWHEIWWFKKYNDFVDTISDFVKKRSYFYG